MRWRYIYLSQTDFIKNRYNYYLWKWQSKLKFQAESVEYLFFNTGLVNQTYLRVQFKLVFCRYNPWKIPLKIIFSVIPSLVFSKIFDDHNSRATSCSARQNFQPQFSYNTFWWLLLQTKNLFSWERDHCQRERDVW